MHSYKKQGKAAKEIHAILIETSLGEHAPSYATVKNWVARFKSDDFSTCDAPHPRRPKTVTTPEIIDQIHELILQDRQILAKSIAEQLGISRGRVGSISMRKSVSVEATPPHTVVGDCGEFQRTERFLQRGI